MENLHSYLPPFEGLLPKWLLLVSIISIGNSIQSYSTLHFTQRVYCGSATSPTTVLCTKPSPSAAPVPLNPGSASTRSPVTPLSARTFGTWTFIASIVRLYAAYNIDNKVAYDLALWTYGGAFAHFASEWLVFGTTSLGAGLAGPLMVSTGSLAWMWLQYGEYVRV